jgi:hypothetical protein
MLYMFGATLERCCGSDYLQAFKALQKDQAPPLLAKKENDSSRIEARRGPF